MGRINYLEFVREQRLLLANKEVVWTPRHPLVLAVPEIMDAFWFCGDQVEVTITSGNDGTHMKNSYHYEDLACDLRRWHLKPGQCEKIKEYLDYRLRQLPQGYCYQTVIEADHIHLEFDPEVEGELEPDS